MNTDLKQKLSNIKALYDDGLIDEADYREEKKALLAASRSGNAQPAPSSGVKATRLDFEPTMRLDAGDRCYQLEEMLGEGGMGQVWRALDEAESEIVGKPVWKAIKILPLTADADPAAYRRLKEEAILASRLSHPNIVRVFDWREVKSLGTPFIVMEWLRGRDLGQLLAADGNPGLPLQLVVELLSPVVEALDYAWKESRLVHRDIKPGNIFLTEEGRIKLLDFGIAARSGKNGSLLGYEGKEVSRSPEYGAPEVASRQKPHPRMDVYGLAILIYALLEGETPFGDNRTPYTPLPDQPADLNDSQWKLLQQGFAFAAEERLETVAEFFSAFASAKPARLRPGDVFRDFEGGPEMVVIPKGEFLTGIRKFSDETPQHLVKIAHDFAIGKYPVTFDEWDACFADGGTSYRPVDNGWGRGSRPVVNVSWEDAQQYLAWISRKSGQTYRLLSEAEWEYACRAGSSTRLWCFGDNENQLGDYAWHEKNSGGMTHPVGQKRANSFGLHDMHGNVLEWVENAWCDMLYSPAEGCLYHKGQGSDGTQRVLRGGSWYNGSGDARTAYRFGYDASIRLYIIGFRLARMLP